MSLKSNQRSQWGLCLDQVTDVCFLYLHPASADGVIVLASCVRVSVCPRVRVSVINS